LSSAGDLLRGTTTAPHNAPPGLPAALQVIGRGVAAITVTRTRLRLTGTPLDLERYYWLPTGIEDRILVRAEHGGTWKPVQLAA